MSAQEEGGREIQTSDLHFITCGPNQLNYLLETKLELVGQEVMPPNLLFAGWKVNVVQ